MNEQSVTYPKGFRAAGIHCGIKREGLDMAMIFSDVPANAAAVYTQNRFQAAPLVLNRAHLAQEGKAQAVVINSGIANAATGSVGFAQAEETAAYVAGCLDIPAHYVLVASTGVIGVPLPMDAIKKGISDLQPNLSLEGGTIAAQAIMTTDTKPKTASATFEVNGCDIRIGGMAKGSGMICPNMATMLGFITTDAAISSQLLQKALTTAVSRSFNCITVDGDTSTNDMVTVMANGASGMTQIEVEDDAFAQFTDALEAVCMDLAKQIAADGEGASRLMEVRITGAADEKDAILAARSVAGSMLVKTALFGKDANWGRIACALGYSGAEFDAEKVDIYIGDLMVAENGQGLTFDEEMAYSILNQPEVVISADLGAGDGVGKAWGCDLTYDYVTINADYRS